MSYPPHLSHQELERYAFLAGDFLVATLAETANDLEQENLDYFNNQDALKTQAFEAGKLEGLGEDVQTVITGLNQQAAALRDQLANATALLGTCHAWLQGEQASPRDILEFYRELTEASDFELETAGCLRGGRKIWALAKTGKETKLKGNDVVQGYLLLATSCDGTLATTATHTSIRVCCANTLAVALDNARGAIKVPHSTTFDPAMVKVQLGIAVSGWSEFMYRMKHLSERKVSDQEAEKFLSTLMGRPEASVSPVAHVTHARGMKKILDLFAGEGRGAELASAKGTAWGLLNATTEFVDHQRRTKSADHRVDSAWFGAGAALKDRALAQALELVA